MMDRLVSLLKRRVKQSPWLYSLSLTGYRVARRLHGVARRLHGGARGAARKARLLLPTRGQLRSRLAEHPHLFVYARHARELLRGRPLAAGRNIARQAAMDWHNRHALRQNSLTLAKLEKLYHEAVLSCVQHRVHKWWDFLPNARFDSVPALQNFLRECVLRRSGDYREFLRIRSKLREMPLVTSGGEEFFDEMIQHFSDSLDAMDAEALAKQLGLDRARRPFLIAFSAWGEHYVGMFLNYCLPSLLTQGNFGALCKERQLILSIRTNAEGRRRIEQAEPVRRAAAMGAVLLYQEMNEPLIARCADDPNHKYWHLGMLQSLDLYLARTLEADYHLLMPDTIYSESHFTGILRAAARGRKVITRLGLSTHMEGICPAVEAYRDEKGVISIPAGDLTSLSIRHVHAACKSWICTHKDPATELPNVYMIMWEGKDRLHMLSPHQTILYLDREITRTLPKRYYTSLDSELDKIVPEDCPAYSAKREDGLCLVEVTSAQQERGGKLTHNPLQEYCRLFWFCTQESMAYWRFFDEDIVDPLNRDMLPGRSYMEEAEIRRAKQALQQALLKSYPATSPEQTQLARSVLQAIHAHSKTKQAKDLLEETLQLIPAAAGEKPPEPPDGLGWYRRRRLRRQQTSALERLYQEAVLCCIRHRVHRWWTFLPHARFNSVPVLQTFLRECVLRRAGDYEEFLRLRGQLRQMSVITSMEEEFFDKMTRHFSAVMEAMDAGLLTQNLVLDQQKRAFVIAFSVWGEGYLNLLLNYCLPSLLAEGNLGALCKERQPVLFIHTDPDGKRRIEESPVTARIKAMGAVIVYQMVNEALVAHFAGDPNCKYWHLGMVQSLDLYFAKTLKADYHLLMPDTVYSEGHFAGLLKAAARGHPVIIRLILSTRMEGICPAVDAYRDAHGAISVPAADLAALSVSHIHSASHAWIVTHKDLAVEASNVHVLVWEGKDTLHLLSPHQTILYLDREVLRGIPKRFYMTLDSELDKVVPAEYPLYHPQPEDEVGLVEMTSEKQRPTEQTTHPAKEFCRIYWQNTEQSMAYWRIFKEAIVDPLNREMLSGRSYMSGDEIRQAKQTIQTALLESYPATSPEQAKIAMEILHTVQGHPQAKNMKPLMAEAADAIRSSQEKSGG